MILDIRNKKINVIVSDEIIKLPSELKNKIDENFEKMKKDGANIWNGEVLCVDKFEISDEKIDVICKISNYAHYLYGERIGLPKEYECKNLSAGCLIETIDEFYVIGELDKCTSFPNMMQIAGGGIDKLDIINKNVNINKTILRETKEELNLDLTNNKIVANNEISYIYISDENEQPGLEFISKAKIKMTANELKCYFEEYYNYLKENNLEIEFSKLHFIKKKEAIEKLEKINNPKRNYLVPLLKLDSEGEKND